MLRIGYIGHHVEDIVLLRVAGCHVLRAEAPGGSRSPSREVLDSVLEFIGEGDELVVGRLERLGLGAQRVLGILDRLDRRGASLRIVQPELFSQGDAGVALRAALAAAAAVETPPPAPRRRAPPTPEIRALRQAGHGPVEIARRLGVSRMTVWRKLKAAEA